MKEIKVFELSDGTLVKSEKEAATKQRKIDFENEIKSFVETLDLYGSEQETVIETIFENANVFFNIFSNHYQKDKLSERIENFDKSKHESDLEKKIFEKLDLLTWAANINLQHSDSYKYEESKNQFVGFLDGLVFSGMISNETYKIYSLKGIEILMDRFCKFWKTSKQ